MRWGTGFRMASLAAGLLAVSVAPAAGQWTWRTMDWEVVCTGALRSLVASTAEERATHLERLMTEYESRWSYLSTEEARRAATEWLDSQLRRARECDSDEEAGLLRLAEEQLESSSTWLRSLGFDGPAIHPFPTADPLDALLDPAEWVVCRVSYCAGVDAFPHAHGVYHPEDLYLHLGLEWNRGLLPDKDLQPGNADTGYTPTHELFHAIQFGYDNGMPRDAPGPWRWLLEGSAELAQLRAAEKGGTLLEPRLVRRHYDDQLHVPPTIESGRRFADWAYGSWEFFEFLGDYTGSTDGVQYLDQVFETRGGMNGLEAVEAVVRRETGTGLYEVFPEFVARRLTSPCYFSHLGTWDDGGCANGPDNEHRFELSFPDTVQRLEHITAPMSANGYLVRIEVPKGIAGQLIIRVPRDLDEEYLHLIVDDQRRDHAGPAGRRNEFTTIVPAGRHEFLVRLADVPRSITATSAHGPVYNQAPIEFILVELDAGITVSSPAGGGSFDPTRWWWGMHTSDEVAAAIPASQSPPPGNACAVQLTLVAEDAVGDEDVSVTLMGWLPAPLAPGTWPVGSYPFEERLGELYADVAVPCQFGGCVYSDFDETDGVTDTTRVRMTDFQGEVEFMDVSRSHVAGRFDITTRQYTGVGLSGIYSVTLGGPAGAGKTTMRADHPCAPASPDSKPGAPGGNGENPGVGNGPGEGPADDDGDPGTDGEENAPPGADGAPGAPPPDAEAGAPGEAGGAGDQEADGAPPEENPEARSGELRASELILGFPQDGRSVLRSEPQPVQGMGSVTGVALVSRTYDLTVALPVFGCTVEMGDVSAAEQFQLALAHQRWLKSGRTVQGLVLFDFTAAEIQLDAASGSVTLDLESAEGGVTMRGTTENAVSLRAGGPATIVGDVSDATLEVTRGDDTFSCAEPMDFSFTVAGMD